MVLLALGTYLALPASTAPLAAPAAAVAIALPFSGFTLYWDAGSWPSGLMAFAYAPWVWSTFRRVLRGVRNPFWAFLVGLLAVTQGNPYGTLAVVTVGFALIVEGIVLRTWGGVAATGPGSGSASRRSCRWSTSRSWRSADLAIRSTGALFENSGKLRPTVGDLFAAQLADVRAADQGHHRADAWCRRSTSPGSCCRCCRGCARACCATAPASSSASASSRPSTSRSPSARASCGCSAGRCGSVEYFYLGVLVVFAVLLSQGLARTSMRPRLVGTGLILVALGWLTWSQDPRPCAGPRSAPRSLAALTVVALAAHLRGAAARRSCPSWPSAAPARCWRCRSACSARTPARGSGTCRATSRPCRRRSPTARVASCSSPTSSPCRTGR